MLILQKSAIDPAFYEIREGDELVKEIPISFRIYQIPRSFPSVQEIERWIKEEERKLAKRTAYRLLNVKNQSVLELQRKLVKRGFSHLVIQEIIEELKRLGYLSDTDFTQTLIESEMRKGHGPLYIERKLRFLGLDVNQVRKVVNDEKEREMIRKLAPRLKNPAVALQRRGFDADLIYSELKNFISRK